MRSFLARSSCAALLTCALGSCALQDETISQAIEGRLIVNGLAASGEVKVLSWDDGDCSAGGVTSAVDEQGEFRIVRSVTQGRLVVVVQHDLICFRQSGPWEVVWRSRPYGPAAQSLAVECIKTGGRWNCKVMTDWGTDVADQG